MFLAMETKFVQSYMRGCYKGAVTKSNCITILDTTDMILETYSMRRFNNLRRKLNINLARIDTRSGSLFSEEHMINSGSYFDECFADKRLKCIYDNPSGAMGFVYYNGVQIFESIVDNARCDYEPHNVYVNCTGKSLFRYKSTSICEDCTLRFMFGQKIGTNLYRVLISVRGEYFPKEDRCVISAMFSDNDFLGVEYVLNSVFEEVMFNKECEIDAGLKARLTLLYY